MLGGEFGRSIVVPAPVPDDHPGDLFGILWIILWEMGRNPSERTT